MLFGISLLFGISVLFGNSMDPRICKKILHSFPGDFKILIKSGNIQKNFMAHFLESPG